MLVEAVFAAVLKASIVLPDVGLKALSVRVKAEGFQSAYALIAWTIPDWQ